MNARQKIHRNRQVGIWLAICAIVVYVMIGVGGATRLTQSGLSMVEWEPLMGTIPPLSQADWTDVFDKYKQSPEYLKINKGMSLPEFKEIFWWEYGHRVLGRLIGLLFFIPFLIFALRGYFSGPWKLKLLGVFSLGGLQAVIGWYMVKSGLVNNPQVSQYRLAAHFGLALLIYTCLVWFALDFIKGQYRRVSDNSAINVVKVKSKAITALVFFMMITGAFVAGTKAGHTYNTFPLMAGSFIPDGIFAMQPAWRNVFENVATIQFIHRIIAYLIGFAVLALFFVGRKKLRHQAGISANRELTLVLVLTVCQILFGITALVLKVPLLWGLLHQVTAVALLTSLLFLTHKLYRDYTHK